MSGRALAGVGLVTLALLALAPAPTALRRDATRRRLALPLDPALRVPFASVLLRGPKPAPLDPGARLLGVHTPGDDGLLVPRDRAALLRDLAPLPPGAEVRLELRVGERGLRRLPTRLLAVGTRRALGEQAPVLVAGAGLLLFALVCAIGGRHPVATALFAVSACLGVAHLAAVDLVLPDEAGLLGIPGLRARTGTLAWTLLPATLLHLASRFPVVVPRFRQPALAALPYALWAVPAALAQLRFHEAAVLQAVERVSLGVSFLAGAILVAACLRPGRRLSPVERSRARAATAGLVGGGAGPLAAFVVGRAAAPPLGTALAFGALAVPAAFGWAVVRYRLLDPPAWVRRVALAAASGLGALLGGAALLTWWPAADAGSPSLALAAAALVAPVHAALTRLARGGAAVADPEALVARAVRELIPGGGPDAVLARLVALLREELGAGAVAWERPGEAPRSPLGARAQVLGASLPAGRPASLRCTARREDPDADAPEVLLRLEPRGGAPVLVALAPRPDGLPWSAGELHALADVGRLAALALGDALDSARLEARVAARTAALRRALDDRTALLEAAECIQAAPDATALRAAVAAFLAGRTGRPARPAAGGPAPGRVLAELRRPPALRERLAVDGLAPERAADLQPQAEAVCALANLALERLHLLDGLKLEVARQARELARVSSGRHTAEFVRRVAHELRKPNEEIHQLAAALLVEVHGPARAPLERIEQATRELARRLDCLLSQQRSPLDARHVDLVRLVERATTRVLGARPQRRLLLAHERPRLPLVGDPVRLASLVENLLDNALRATGEGGRLAVRTALLAPRAGGPWVSLEIEDDGIGVPPELGAEIFEPGVGRFRDGFGLGLALCRDVAALHGGRMELASRPGRTVFRVLLPQLGVDRLPASRDGAGVAAPPGREPT